MVVSGQQTGPADFVDPFIGTDFFGHTFPGPCLPFGMVHPGPDTDTRGWASAAGYKYSDNTIIGFSHTHWSGVGMVSGGEVLIMPGEGIIIQTTPGTPENPDEGYRSRFRHETEDAAPGYYSVILDDNKIKAELTATKRVAFHRYTFPRSDNSRIIIDLGHQIGNNTSDELSGLTILPDNKRIEGVKSSSLGKVFFSAEFNKPFRYFGTFDNEYKTPESGSGLFPYKTGESGKNIGAFVTFKTSENEQILVKVGISYVSIEGARNNLVTEIPHWDFDKVRSDAYNAWNKELSKVSITDPSQEQKQIFYTALYRSLLAQYIYQDADGKYFGADKKIHMAKGFDFYSSFSCWDTYRSQHPLLTLIAPEHVSDFIKSIEAKTKEFGWLPAQHFQNNFNPSMAGDHLIPVIVDAYNKGFHDFDATFLYDAMRKKALEKPEPPVPENLGRSGIEYYISLGYVPYDKATESVSNTLELAYDDWCIAQLAKALGKSTDYELFTKRAGYYANLWDRETMFMRPRNAAGTWLEALNGREQEIAKDGSHSWYKYFDPLLVGRRPNRHYSESNAWQYLWSVQHDVKGLVDLFGSASAFSSKLDTFFNMSPEITPPKYVGVVGTIGQYVHGNQPSHHVAYLYDFCGEPWKTQERVRQVCNEFYRSGPGGLCGNEDMGSLSSWFVFSALGFYPVTPGNPVYMIGSPLFEKATISVGQKKSFTVTAKNNSPENIYIQSATLNGKSFNRTWISHKEITEGGELIFTMGPEPAKKWGTGKDAVPVF
jgi:predicted alpha-1,2-mannosidase